MLRGKVSCKNTLYSVCVLHGSIMITGVLNRINNFHEIKILKIYPLLVVNFRIFCRKIFKFEIEN